MKFKSDALLHIVFIKSFDFFLYYPVSLETTEAGQAHIWLACYLYDKYESKNNQNLSHFQINYFLA
jgi:hypothetical protein